MPEYIERDVALKALCQVSAPTPSESYIVEKCIDKINEVPTAEVAPLVHAYWKKEIEDGMYWYACSECSTEVPKTRYKTDLFSDFCPHCGAKMDDV